MRHIEPLAGFGLPTVVREDRTQQPDAILLLTLHEQVRIDVAGIHDLLLGQEVMLSEVLFNDLGHVHVLHIGDRRLHSDNQLRHGSSLRILRCLRYTRFGQMNLVAEPRRLPLLARACYGAHRGTA